MAGGSAALISAADLRAALADAHPPLLLDCGYDLADPEAGARAHAAGHIAGAVYADLGRDLAGLPGNGRGRHPLPDRDAFAATAGRWGIAPGVPVVCYDAQGGPYAARAWWLLRWLGHEAVSVLDGGVAAWVAAGGELVAAQSRVAPRPPYPAAPALPTIDAAALLSALGGVRLFDARATERYAGAVEPLDAVAGHIPGATSRPFKDNLQPDGRFKEPAALRLEFEALGVGDDDNAAAVVHQCGSGVTACHNLLAMVHAGWPPGRLYPGSWSEWCSDPARPVARA